MVAEGHRTQSTASREGTTREEEKLRRIGSRGVRGEVTDSSWSGGRKHTSVGAAVDRTVWQILLWAAALGMEHVPVYTFCCN